MKKRSRWISCFIFAIIILCGAVFLILNSEALRTSRLTDDLSKRYGSSFEVISRETESVLFSPTHTYTIRSGEGTRFLAERSWNGKLLSDSYAHYYYAEDLNRMIEDCIGDCFDEYYVVRDCWQYGSSKNYIELVDTSDSASPETYMGRDTEITVTFRVYIKEGRKAEPLLQALERLKEREIGHSVYFLAVPDNIYRMVSGSGLFCYYPYSHVSETLLAHSDDISEAEIEKLIADPFLYTVAEYVPKYDHVRLLASREYFESLDRESSPDDLCDALGPYGIRGSGILYFTWKLNDGGEASVVFNSREEIERIYIRHNDESELIYNRHGQ